MRRALLLFGVLYAAVGLTASVVVHAYACFGQRIGGTGLFAALHIGIFPIWLPVVLLPKGAAARAVDPNTRNQWMAGVPRWMSRGLTIFFVYAIANFAWFTMHAPPKGSRQLDAHGQKVTPPIVWRGFSGHWMIFYGAALAAMLAAYRREPRDRVDARLNTAAAAQDN